MALPVVVKKVKTSEGTFNIADTSARAKLDALREKTSALTEVNAAKCSVRELATSYNNLLKAVQEAVAVFVITALSVVFMNANAGISVTPSWADHNVIEGDRQTMVNSKAWTEAAVIQINANASDVSSLNTKLANERKDKGGGVIPASTSLKDYIDTKTIDPSIISEVVNSAIATEKTNKTNQTGIPNSTSIKQFIDTRTLGYDYNLTNVTIGTSAHCAGSSRGSTVINPYRSYPSYTYGAFNICLGIDNLVGYQQQEGVDARYAVAIGTSDRAAGMHSYAFGSQINSLISDSTVIGYGLSATSAYSVVIGHGSRTIWDKQFASASLMTNFLKSAGCKSEIFKGYGILTSGGPGCDYIVDEVLTTADPITGMYATIRESPLDIETGSRRWFYGKSHGRGTFNIVAVGDGVNDYGIARVFVNDKSLSDWTGVHVGEPTRKEIYNMGVFGPETTYCANDYTISIGSNAKALEAAESCQAIAIGRDALSAGAATVAVGPNSFAIGDQAAAFGWRANAVGAHSIAIGCAKKAHENYYKDGAVNPNSDLCVAEGAESIAIGYNAKGKAAKAIAIGDNAQALASGSAQIGTGITDKPNTLQFQNVVIVREGKLVGNFEVADLDPTNIYVDTVCFETAITCTPHRINTLAATAPLSDSAEMSVFSRGMRNFEVYIPNEQNFREALPINFVFGLPVGVKHALRSEAKVIGTLPITVKCVQPVTNMVIVTTEAVLDGDDWTPVVDRCNLTYTTDKGIASVGHTALRGHNLQLATECLLTYPVDGTPYTTNILTLTSGNTYSQTSRYRYTQLAYKPPADKLFDIDGSKTWFEIKYTTVNGSVTIPRIEVDILNPVVTYGLTGNVTWVDDSTTEVSGNGHFELPCGSAYKVYRDDVRFTYVKDGSRCTDALSNATYDSENNKFVFPNITGLTFVDNVSTNVLSFKTVEDERLTALVHVIEKQ